MPYSVYKVLHIVGILMIFIPMGGLLLHVLNGGTAKFPARRWAMITHGIGMAITLIAGFGLLARIGITGAWPLWIWLKLVLWLLLGMGVAFILRKPKFAKFNWWLLILLGGLGAFLANYKPTF